MFKDVYLVFLLAINFLKKNVSVLIPFYIAYLLFWFSEWIEYGIGISYVLSLFLYAFVAIVIYEKENEMVVNVYKWQIIVKALLNSILLFLFNLIAFIVGIFLLGLVSLFVPMVIIYILIFILLINAIISFIFGVFAVSFSKNTTPNEAMFLGLRSFYKNFPFYIIVIVTGVLVFMFLAMLEILINVNSLALLIYPILAAIQVTSLAFAFWQKTKDKNNLIIA